MSPLLAVAVLLAGPACALKDVLLFAHRGDSVTYPENTLEAFMSALDKGADINESDMHLSADGVPVLIHDSSVTRTTNGTGAVSSLTLAELKSLDAGYTFTRDGGATFPFRGMGLTIPTVEEALEKIPAKFNIDIKQHTDEAAQIMAATIARLGAQDRIIIASFDDRTLAAFREALPGVETGVGPVEVARFAALFAAGRGDEHEPVGTRYQLPPGFVRDMGAFIEGANANGQFVDYWTINDDETMVELLGEGADGIMTDDPSLAYAVFQRLGLRP